MIEDDVITRLVQLHDHIQAPATLVRLDARRGQRLVRQRRTASVVTVAAAVVLAFGAGQSSLFDDKLAQLPAQQPSPATTELVPTGSEWTPERIRAEGSPADLVRPTAAGLSARQYVVCDGSRCTGNSGPAENLHVAVELSQGGLSALYEVRGARAWTKPFDKDSLLVLDTERLARNQPVRYRLLRADGIATELQLLAEPAPPIPGPSVVAVPPDLYDFVAGSIPGMAISGLDPLQKLYLVDRPAGTLRPLDAPEAYWGPDLGEFLWAATADCHVVWADAGVLKTSGPDCKEAAPNTTTAGAWIGPGWFQPGRMALAEWHRDVTVYVTLDYGATWQEVPVKGDALAGPLPGGR